MRKNVKQNALDSAEKDSRITYKDEVVEKSDFRTYTRKSNGKLREYYMDEEDCNSSEYLADEWEQLRTTKGWKRRKTTGEDIASDKDDLAEIAIWGEEVELNTGTKQRGQAQKRRKNPRGKIESEKEDPHEIAASVEQKELYTATKRRVTVTRTRENVECEKQGQEKTVSKSRRVENGRRQEEKEKEKVEESESGNASQPRNRKRKDKNGNEIGSNMCHQCQRNDKGRVARCTNCKTKRYCVPCMNTWYPEVPKVAFKESSPVCRQNCNCKACLRIDGPIRPLKNLYIGSTGEEKIQYSKFIVQKLLPFFRRFNAEQVMEMEIEAKIQAAKDLQQEDLKHFQCHWLKGEPAIVSNVLEMTSGLSWEPMVMWRACHQIKNLNWPSHLNVCAINCLNWCEVKVNIHQFFKGYMGGQFDSAGWPQILKLKDSSSSDSFDEQLPRHSAEFVRSLPFKEYTHPQSGYLNLSVKLRSGSLMPDMRPKTCYCIWSSPGAGAWGL